MLESKLTVSVAIVLVIGLLLSGCFGTRMLYPEDWAPLAGPDGDACRDISGKYRAISDPLAYYSRPCTSVGKGWYCRSLPEDLLGITKTVTEDTWVEISGSDGTELGVAVGVNETIQYKVTLRAATGQFACTEDGVVVKIKPEFMAGDGAVGINAGFEYSFGKATDGSLVMKEATSGGGVIFFVIPVAGSSMQWWKWRALER